MLDKEMVEEFYVGFGRVLFDLAMYTVSPNKRFNEIMDAFEAITHLLGELDD